VENLIEVYRLADEMLKKKDPYGPERILFIFLNSLVICLVTLHERMQIVTD